MQKNASIDHLAQSLWLNRAMSTAAAQQQLGVWTGQQQQQQQQQKTQIIDAPTRSADGSLDLSPHSSSTNTTDMSSPTKIKVRCCSLDVVIQLTVF
jgi:hypothetical protein